MRVLFELDRDRFRVWVFCSALLLYAGFSSPTPDSLGLVEILIGCLLVLAVGVSGAVHAVHFRKGEACAFLLSAQLLLFFGVVAPLLVGAISGHDPRAVIRDVVPFLFMVLPLFMNGLLEKRPASFWPILYAALGVGSLLSLRNALGSDPLYYLANMPTVLMAAIFFGGSALSLFTKRWSVLNVVRISVMLALSGLAVMAMVETQQRASLGAFVLALLIILAQLFCKNPRKALVLMVLVLATAASFMDQILSSLDVLMRKSELVGFNMRFQEFAAVWGEISGNLLTLLFGKGWGASFSSPAVADIRVFYTHSLVSSMLLKAGLIGFMLSGFYIISLLKPMLGMIKTHLVLVCALVFPVLIDVFLYASFKSLDFGVMLLVARAAVHYRRVNMYSAFAPRRAAVVT